MNLLLQEGILNRQLVVFRNGPKGSSISSGSSKLTFHFDSAAYKRPLAARPRGGPPRWICRWGWVEVGALNLTPLPLML